MEKLAALAMNRAAARILRAAIELTPMETGALRASGKISKYAEEGDLHVVITFDTPYAAAQHEGKATMRRGGTAVRASSRASAHVRGGTTYEWRAQHYSTPGTGPKYLEWPMKDFTFEYEHELAKVIQAGLEARFG
jgi:hypothetical protein